MRWRFRTASEFEKLTGQNWRLHAQVIFDWWRKFMVDISRPDTSEIKSTDVQEYLGTFPGQKLQSQIDRILSRPDLIRLNIDMVKYGGSEIPIPIDMSIIFIQDFNYKKNSGRRKILFPGWSITGRPYPPGKCSCI